MAGRTEAFDRLLAEHGAALRATVRRLCRRPQDADDIWQETALRVWRGMDRMPWLRNPRGWLATIAYRAWIDHSARHPPAAEAFDRADDRAAAPDGVAVALEQRALVRDATAALPAELRAVVALHYTAGLSLRDTAAALGVPPGTAKSRLHAALNLLRKELA